MGILAKVPADLERRVYEGLSFGFHNHRIKPVFVVAFILKRFERLASVMWAVMEETFHNPDSAQTAARVLAGEPTAAVVIVQVDAVHRFESGEIGVDGSVRRVVQSDPWIWAGNPVLNGVHAMPDPWGLERAVALYLATADGNGDTDLPRSVPTPVPVADPADFDDVPEAPDMRHPDTDPLAGIGP